ncbi:MAG: peptide-methionine (S)-S-oxide reductase MsrA [Pseudomonadales bacterium]
MNLTKALRKKSFLFTVILVSLSVGASEDADVPKTAEAIFAGGCFWCMEPPYDELPGVISTTSGYIGGHTRNPAYEEVSRGETGHTEAVKVVYDPRQVNYSKLLEVFWRNIDPLAVDRQFCDVGDQYRTGIYYLNDQQKRLATASKKDLEKSGKFEEPLATEIESAGVFYPAEQYHQNYYKKNPLRYKFYRYNCGRDERLEELWGTDPS